MLKPSVACSSLIARQNMSVSEDPNLDEQFRDLDEILTPLFNSQALPDVLSEFQARDSFRGSNSIRQPCQAGALPPSNIVVQITDLKDIYDKNQKKTLTGSEQRIVDSKVNMIVSTSEQVKCVKVFVQRCPEAASKTNDIIGPVSLMVTVKKYDQYGTHLTVDLDSVYKTQNGDMIYWLDKVEVEERNKWRLIIIVELTNGSCQQFQSRSFRIRTKPRRQKTSDSSMHPGEQ